MRSERIQRQIDRLLDEADEAMRQLAWDVVRDRARAALALDRENSDAHVYFAAAEAQLSQSSPRLTSGPGSSVTHAGPAAPAAERAPVAQPASFCDGRYQVVRFLGEGGKKRVYLAHDTKLDRDVAFAVIKTDGLDDEGLARIKREAQAMGRLGDHPHIVSVFDIGEEASQPYVVTQLMGGGDVGGLIEKAPEHRVPMGQALRIADEVCQALEHAHNHGVVHRDLKPGNVWLTAALSTGSPSTREAGSESAGRTGQAVAKLGDFGLALALDRSRLTQAGMMVGTVSYMPPEQALGGAVTPTSDLYSLGAMLYELVTGRPPFVGDESVAIITQHLNTPPVAPSWHVPDLPPGLEALILRLLEKDPAKRPQSAAEVRQILASIQSEPISLADGGERVQGYPELGPDPIYRRTFVGRERELQELEASFSRAVSGQGSLTMVVGEPGIGKTALCEQVATFVAMRGGRALVGHCYEEGSLSLPYLPFVEALRTYVLAREPDGLKQDLGSGAAEVARIISEVRDRIAVELRPTSDPEDDRWRLLQAVTGFLRNAASVQPILLMVEDLHWADRGTLDLLIHVARNLAGARLLLVGTYRDIEVDRAHPLSAALAELRRVGEFRRIPLRGLTVDEVHRMMNIMRGQEVPWSRAEAIHRQTEGNPLFVQEVLRYLVEEGLVVREAGRFLRTDGADPAAGIPEGLRDVIGRRLSKLSPECNQLLAIAAAVGRDFDLAVLRRVADVAEDQLLAGLEEASRVAVIEERAGVGAQVRYRFSHALFRQTLYQEMIAPRRIRLHQEVARALESLYAQRREEHAAELAEHFSFSSDPADLAKAVSYGEMAARRAVSVHAYGEAVRRIEQAIQVQEVLDPGDRARRCDLLLAFAEALLPAGEPLRVADEVADQAFVLAEELGDGRKAARACRLALDGLQRYGVSVGLSLPRGNRWVERADLCSEPGTVERVYADWALTSQARGPERRHAFLRALEGARQLADPSAMFILASGFLLDSPPELWDERLTIADEISSLPFDGVPTNLLSVGLWYLAATSLGRGDRGRAEELSAHLREIAARTRDPYSVLRAAANDMRLAVLDGRLEDAAAMGADVATRGEDLGSSFFGRNSRLYVCRPLIWLGRPADALDVVADWRRAGQGSRFINEVRTILCLAHLGQATEALSQLREYATILSDPDSVLGTLLVALEAAVLLGDRETAAILVHRLAGLAGAIGMGSQDVNCVGLHLGAAYALLGKPDAARAAYQEGLAVCEKARFRPEIALIRLGLAELLLEQFAAERAEALAHVDFAIDEFQAMKMQPALERAFSHKGLLRA